MTAFKKTAISMAAAQAALLWAGSALAQTTAPASPPAATATKPEVLVVTGRRKALETAQKIKQDSDEIVDSVVAEEMGKLPDNSVTEVLQRIVGVTMDRTAARNDPVHYSVEGSGVIVRGLTYVSAQLNGRETFAANQGRGLSFEDVTPELMQAVDVYKNPSAEQIEGAIAGQINLRTALPFDHKGFKASLSFKRSYGDLRGESTPEFSGLVTNTWNTDFGKIGLLVDLARAKSKVRTDTMTVDPYYRLSTLSRSETVNGNTVNYYTPNATEQWAPRQLGWRRQDYDRTRDGVYAALQWQKGSMESSLTYFQSKYKFDMSELAFSGGIDPYSTAIADGVWDNGVLVKGTLRDTGSAGGFEFDNASRFGTRTSKTEDLGWNFRWRVNNQWTLTQDLQYVRSSTHGFDSSVATGVQLPKQSFDLTGSVPQINFDSADLAILNDPSKHYWAYTMEHQDKGSGHQKAWRGDARFQFADNPVLSDLRFGLRVAEREARTERSNPDYNWAAVTKSWLVGSAINQLAYVTNYSDPTARQAFDNFMGGSAQVPALLFPAASVVKNYPGSYESLHGHYQALCSAKVEGWYQFITGKDGTPAKTACDLPWTPQAWNAATFGDGNPAAVNDQRERTYSGYAQLRFDLEDLGYPVDGNVGLRVVRTEGQAQGYTVLTVGNTVPSNMTTARSFAAPETFDNTFTNALPSLNLRLKANKELQFRFAWSKGLSRPAFSDMQAYTTLKLDAELEQGTGAVKRLTMSGSANGNPLLRPVQANQQDATAEWYFSRTGAFTAALFNKDFKDVILDQTTTRTLTDSAGNAFDFVVTSKANAAKGRARGFEVAFRQYFDMLPGWMSGLGVDANYTYIDSKMRRYNEVRTPYCSAGNGADNLNLFINGCDTDGRTFGSMPLPNLSRNSYNLALLYDKGPVSLRLAYAWRQRHLQGVALNADNTGPNQQNGLDTNPDSASVGRNNLPIGLPLWAEDYGQVDLGAQYKFNEQLTLQADASNITDATYKQLMQQHIGFKLHNHFTSGRRYSVGLRYTF